jgi:D-glycero-alpha-D-manno-heptose 1-phosphate guanylyltransferase
LGSIDAIILAGGFGTRLRSVLSDLPKPLAPVRGRPFLDFLLDHLNRWPRVGRVVLAVGYMGDKIIEEYKGRKGFRFDIRFSGEREPLGTGGGIRKALGMTVAGDILALNGDSFVRVDLEELFLAHRSNDADMTVVVRKEEDAGRYGRVLLGPNGRIVSFDEKSTGPASGYINAGVYLFKRNVFDDAREGVGMSLEREIIPSLLDKGVFGFITRGKFIDIGLPESYRTAEEYFGEIDE